MLASKIITKDYKLRIIHVNIGAMGHVKMMLRLVFECSGSLDIGKFVDLMMLWTSKLSQSLNSSLLFAKFSTV